MAGNSDEVYDKKPQRYAEDNVMYLCTFSSRKRSPNGAFLDWDGGHLIAAYNSFIYPERMKGWVDLVAWPIADGLLT